MTIDHTHHALRLVEPRAVVPGSERRLAVEHWLLATLPRERRQRARAEWGSCGMAMLPMGGLFSAVRIPGELVYAITQTQDRHVVHAFLNETLAGPVICDPRFARYYALVPVSMPGTWRKAFDDWRTRDVDCLGRGTYLGVPRPEVVQDSRDNASYWAVSMDSPAMLCAPLAVARLVAAGWHSLDAEPQG